MLDVKNNVIPNRRQKARGRLTKDETARVQYITGVGLANVHLGKLPSPEDQRALLLPALHEVKQVGGKTVSKLSKEGEGIHYRMGEKSPRGPTIIQFHLLLP